MTLLVVTAEIYLALAILIVGWALYRRSHGDGRFEQLCPDQRPSRLPMSDTLRRWDSDYCADAIAGKFDYDEEESDDIDQW